MMKQLLFFLSVLLFFHFHCTPTLAQGPAPAGPTNITKILEKAGQFTVLIRLLGTTQMADRINGQLNDTNQGMTIFAPTDNAFSSLKAGTLNSLADQQKAELVQFHVIPTFLSTAQFQTVSNPLSTQAGSSNPGQFPLNVTTAGNSVNISTGVVNASVANTIYSDNQLAVYQVDKVLLPMSIFASPAPTPAPASAPAPSAPEKKKSQAATAPSADADASGAVTLTMHGMAVSIGVAVIASFLL